MNWTFGFGVWMHEVSRKSGYKIYSSIAENGLDCYFRLMRFGDDQCFIGDFYETLADAKAAAEKDLVEQLESLAPEFKPGDIVWSECHFSDSGFEEIELIELHVLDNGQRIWLVRLLGSECTGYVAEDVLRKEKP